MHNSYVNELNLPLLDKTDAYTGLICLGPAYQSTQNSEKDKLFFTFFLNLLVTKRKSLTSTSNK